jgi:hypothetical protein
MDQIEGEGGVNGFSLMMVDDGMVWPEFRRDDNDSSEVRRSGVDTWLRRSGFELGMRKFDAGRGNRRRECTMALHRVSVGEKWGGGV